MAVPRMSIITKANINSFYIFTLTGLLQSGINTILHFMLIDLMQSVLNTSKSTKSKMDPYTTQPGNDPSPIATMDFGHSQAANEPQEQHQQQQNRANPQRIKKPRPSKYGPEPPESIYGPPFVTKPLTTDLTQEEMRARIAYNDQVMEARKVFHRHKNNAAAKRSRQRKEDLIESLSKEVTKLTAANEETTAANRKLMSINGDAREVQRANRELGDKLAEARSALVERDYTIRELRRQLGIDFGAPQPQPDARFPGHELPSLELQGWEAHDLALSGPEKSGWESQGAEPKGWEQQGGESSGFDFASFMGQE
ncbi:hypothetical protein F5Y15DRAFT_415315 [Xylariaceae sp. FL0016]|nr:hypothetical protein F5Y15DRAFT_415315 [Xylariaceae sp. FL0016]